MVKLAYSPGEYRKARYHLDQLDHDQLLQTYVIAGAYGSGFYDITAYHQKQWKQNASRCRTEIIRRMTERRGQEDVNLISHRILDIVDRPSLEYMDRVSKVVEWIIKP